MALLRSEALLLRAVDFGESDRIVHLLTPDAGRMTAMAKGARRSAKRFAGSLDLFNYLKIDVFRPPRAAMARLEQAVLVDAFLPLRADTGRYALACYLFELMDRLAPEGGARRDTRELFGFAHSALQALESTVPDTRLRVLLELCTLSTLGLRPELRRCVRCGEEPGSQQARFHVGEGGVICGRCEVKLQGLLSVHLGTLRVLEQALHFAPQRLERLHLAGQALEEARSLMGRFLHFHLGVHLRSEAFLDRMLEGGRASGPAGSA